MVDLPSLFRPKPTLTAAPGRRSKNSSGFPRQEQSGLWWLTIVVGLVVIGVLIRLLLFHRLATILTNDSADYILASEAILADWDFRSPHFRDWRFPGYPLFLALIASICRLSSQAVVVAQVFVGMASVGAGLAIGWRLKSPVWTILVTACLALNPVFLLNEHLVMTETLFLFFSVLTTWLGLSCIDGSLHPLKAVALGLSTAACILTRPNGILLCGIVVIGVILYRLIGSARHSKAKVFELGRFAVICFVAGSIPLGAWVFRNFQMFGRISIVNLTNRSRVIYLEGHGLFDPNLPLTSQYFSDFDPNYPHTIYGPIANLSDQTRTAEALAAAIVHEQISHRRGEFALAMVSSLFNFTGIPTPAPIRYPRSDLAWWFASLVPDVDAIRAIPANAPWREYSSFEYITSGSNGVATNVLSRSGLIYLKTGRQVLGVGFLVGIVVIAVASRRDRRRSTDRFAAWLILTAGFLTTALAHAVNLGDLDRFYTTFDWLVVGSIALSLELWMDGRRSVSESSP